mmetsp:Transcript_105727/g.299052  ORF Transcript_105727/g.299052 Transcript_105727/m.299052 type:complete len:244 (-) Transcript_105727:57-788(-)
MRPADHARCPDGATAPMIAAAGGHEAVVRLLAAERGTDVHARGPEGASAPMEAAAGGREAGCVAAKPPRAHPPGAAHRGPRAAPALGARPRERGDGVRPRRGRREHLQTRGPVPARAEAPGGYPQTPSRGAARRPPLVAVEPAPRVADDFPSPAPGPLHEGVVHDRERRHGALRPRVHHHQRGVMARLATRRSERESDGCSLTLTETSQRQPSAAARMHADRQTGGRAERRTQRQRSQHRGRR